MSANMYQVSTLQALALGYTRAMVTVGQLMQHGEAELVYAALESQYPGDHAEKAAKLAELTDNIFKIIEKWGDDNATGAQSVFNLCLYLIQNHGAKYVHEDYTSTGHGAFNITPSIGALWRW